MADSNITGGGTGGGGGGLHFRDPVDVFANEAARTTAFSAGGTLVGEHVQFESDRSLAIVIGTIANPTQFQTYTGGTTYDDDTWLDRADAVQGRTGATGGAGPAGTDGTDGADGVPDGVLDDASFDTTTYEATLERTIGADVALDLSPIDTRIAALESATPPTPHTNRRYAALRSAGATAADFTAANFLASDATFSDTQDIDSPASNTDMVMGIAVPMSEGELTGVAELDGNGNLNPLASMIRFLFIPAVGDTGVTLTISGASHYVYATSSIIYASSLGAVGYRLTQTP